MPIQATAPVLDARAVAISDAPRVTAWCRAHVNGWVWFGDTHTGSNPMALTWVQAERHALQRAVQAECWRSGVPVRALWGFRLDVIGPAGGRAAPRAPLARDMIATSAIEYVPALQASGLAWGVAPWLDGGWWSGVPRDAAVYLRAVGDRYEIVGALTALWNEDVRDDLVAEAAARVVALECDGLLVGLKPWLRAGPAPDPSLGLVQPTPYGPHQWEFAHSLALMSLAERTAVLTLTRPFTDASRMGIGGTAAAVVTAEAALVRL